jgi:hypothetical protein
MQREVKLTAVGRGFSFEKLAAGSFEAVRRSERLVHPPFVRPPRCDQSPRGKTSVVLALCQAGLTTPPPGSANQTSRCRQSVQNIGHSILVAWHAHLAQRPLADEHRLNFARVVWGEAVDPKLTSPPVL